MYTASTDVQTTAAGAAATAAAILPQLHPTRTLASYSGRKFN